MAGDPDAVPADKDIAKHVTQLGGEVILEQYVIDNYPELAVKDFGLSVADGQRPGRRPRIFSIDIPYDTRLQPEDFEILGRAEELRWLSLGGPHSNDHDLRILSGFPELRKLSLTHSPITNRVLPSIAKLTKLETLHLDRTRISDAGISLLGGLRNLKTLTVTETKLRSPVFPTQAEWPAIREINLHSTSFTDLGCERIAHLDSLETLMLDFTRVTDEGVARLGGMPRLDDLSLSYTEVQGVGFCTTQDGDSVSSAASRDRPKQEDAWHTGRALGLRRLHLNQTRTSDRGLQYIARISSIEHLDLSETPVTDAGLKRLVELKNIKWLNLSGTQVTDDGVFAALPRLKSLQRVSLHGTSVTAEGVARLIEMMPRCEISHPSNDAADIDLLR